MRKIIGHGVQLVAAVPLEQVADPVAPAATANEAQFDLAAGRRGFFGGQTGRRAHERRRCRGGQGAAQELATRVLAQLRDSQMLRIHRYCSP